MPIQWAATEMPRWRHGLVLAMGRDPARYQGWPGRLAEADLVDLTLPRRVVRFTRSGDTAVQRGAVMWWVSGRQTHHPKEPTMTTTIAIRFVDLDGMTVITGEHTALAAALTCGAPVVIDGQSVTLIGDVEVMDDGAAVCDFAERGRVDIRVSRPRGRECVTGGNCSSHGDGRSCGGWGCDGYDS